MNNEDPTDPIEPIPADDALPEHDPPLDAPADASEWVPEDESPGDDVAADLDAFVTLAAERDEYLDALRRTQADFENFRKRMQREATEARDAGRRDLGEKLIDVLDVVDYALGHDPSDSVQQIGSKL